jgi:hypothetical protein
MPNFRLSTDREIAAEKKYRKMLQKEITRREAIVEGRKHYDRSKKAK